jgi:hypothetical protein
MSGDEVLARAAAHAASFREGLAGRLQRPQHGYAEALAAFAGAVPEQGAEAGAILDDLVARATLAGAG